RRRGGRVVEGGGLENRYGSLAHREFESLPLRHRHSARLDPNARVARENLALLGPNAQDKSIALPPLSDPPMTCLPLVRPVIVGLIAVLGSLPLLVHPTSAV